MPSKKPFPDKQRSLPSIRTRVYRLVLACALPSLAAFVLLTDHFYQRELAQIQNDALTTARALAQALDRDLATGMGVARALANSPSLDQGDLAGFHEQASRTLHEEFPGFNFVLSDASGAQLVNTVRPFGPAVPDPGSAAQVRQVFATGKAVISELFVGVALRRPVVAVRVPVMRDGKVIYCLSAGFLPERLGKVLREQHLPPDRVAGILDPQGLVVARTRDPERYVGHPGAPSLLAELPRNQENAIESVTLEGIPVYSMFSRSPVSRYVVVIGVPRSVVVTEMLASIQWLALGLILLFVAGFGAAWQLAGGIARAVASLSAAAVALGGKQPPEPVRASFREAGDALTTLRQVEEELLRHRHRLENLIGERTLQLQSAMAQLQQASAAKDVFVANMSHELRTPMNAVLGMAHLLGTTGLSAEQQRYLEMIQASGRSLLAILNDILDYSKMQAGKVELNPVRFKLDDVLQALAAIMSVNAGEKPVELCIGAGPDVPRLLMGDAQRLQQILINLVGNAIKFTDGGEVAVLVERVDDDDVAAAGGADNNADNNVDSGENRGNSDDHRGTDHDGDHGAVTLRFIVRDTGIGMSGEQLERLFSPFAQADPSTTRRYGGTGLGLTISKGLASLMGGAIEVRSDVGAGSEFRLTVPLRLSGGVIEPARPAASHLLLVAHNPTSRACIAGTIASLGWSCDAVASGGAAVKRLADDGANFDAVLVDWNLAGMDGQRTMGLIQAIRPDGDGAAPPPLICMANAYARGQLTTEMAQAGAAAFLTKPVTAAALAEAVRAALARRPAGALAHAQPLPDKIAPAGFPGLRVLLVEDNPINQHVARGILEHAGAAVAVAENGQVAVDMLRADGGRYDLVLMDVQMPVMDGFAATRRIRDELRLTLPVIAMTAGVMASEREQCIAAGMDDFIGKPVDVDQMFATMGRHLRGA